MKLSKIIAIAALVGLSACSRQTFNMSDNIGDLKENNTTHFFVGGIGQEKEIRAAEICGGPENLAKVESYDTFVNVLADQLTFGIYSPKQARVYCITKNTY